MLWVYSLCKLLEVNRANITLHGHVICVNVICFLLECLITLVQWAGMQWCTSVAKWLRLWTNDPRVVGSNPVATQLQIHTHIYIYIYIYIYMPPGEWIWHFKLCYSLQKLINKWLETSTVQNQQSSFSYSCMKVPAQRYL